MKSTSGPDSKTKSIMTIIGKNAKSFFRFWVRRPDRYGLISEMPYEIMCMSLRGLNISCVRMTSIFSSLATYVSQRRLILFKMLVALCIKLLALAMVVRRMEQMIAFQGILGGQARFRTKRALRNSGVSLYTWTLEVSP